MSRAKQLVSLCVADGGGCVIYSIMKYKNLTKFLANEGKKIITNQQWISNKLHFMLVAYTF